MLHNLHFLSVKKFFVMFNPNLSWHELKVISSRPIAWEKRLTPPTLLTASFDVVGESVKDSPEPPFL